MVFYMISLLLILFMVLLVPKSAFKINRVAAFVIIMLYSLIYLFLLNVLPEQIGLFHSIDVLIFLAVLYLITYRPVKFSLLNIKEYYLEFDLFHKALTIVLLLIYVYFRHFNIGLTWPLKLQPWIITLLITMMGIAVSSFIAVKIKFVKYSWLKSNFKEFYITAINMFFFVALPEEIFFRGLVYSFLLQFTGNVILSFVISIVIFGIAHIRYGVGMVILGGLTGIFYTLVYVLTGNLYCAAIIHTLVNLFRKYFLINTKKG